MEVKGHLWASWLIFLMILMACIFIGVGIFFLLYKAKLIIPKSKLFDDQYIEKSIQRVKLFRRISFAILVVQMIIMILATTLFVLNTISFQFTDGFIVFSVIFIANLPFSLWISSIRVYYPNQFTNLWNAEDVRYRISKKRRSFRR